MYDFLDKIGLKAVLEAIKGKMPTSLPANGGNADTVDGLHASDFMPINGEVRKYGLIRMNGTDGIRARHIDGNNTEFDGALYLNYNSPNAPIYMNGGNIAIHSGNIGSQSVNYATNAGNADTINGHTVNADVPADAIFTDTIVNENLLINPDFRINQRGNTSFSVSYHQTTPIEQSQKYTVDRWRIMDGEASITNGKFVLNGTIIQVLENSIGTDFAASVSVETGSATASYDDTTKTFTIKGNNATLNWAKLERGNATTAFVPPDPATELLKCMRYYETIMSAGCDRAGPANLLPDLRVEIDFQFKIPKRAIPSLATNTLRFVVTTSTGYNTINLSVQQHASDINGMSLATVNTVLTELPTYLLGVTVDVWGLGAFAVDAEIY